MKVNNSCELILFPRPFDLQITLSILNPVGETGGDETIHPGQFVVALTHDGDTVESFQIAF